jgi:DNA-binding NtrC family response regulator
VIAATNKDLESEVRHGRFRADLFFRLRSVNIYVPPLRSRPEDIPVFFRRFAEEVAAKNGIRFTGISDAAMQVLQSYHWPGNVRELRNVVESMLVLEGGKYIGPEEVQKYLKDFRSVSAERNLPVPMGKSVEQAERELILRALLDIKGDIIELRNMLAEQNEIIHAPGNNRQEFGYSGEGQEDPTLTLQEMEHKMIADALSRYKGNRRVAARALKISERTLYRKIKEYGLG